METAGSAKKTGGRLARSYRGCKACRAAKKKCSEDKPVCGLCNRNKVTCEYDIDCVLRIVDGKPKRRSSAKGKEKALPVEVSEVEVETAPEAIAATSDDTISEKDSVDLLSGPLLDTNIVPIMREPAVLLEFEIDLGPEESHYIRFFLTKVKHTLPYFECFPTMASDIFNRATTHPALLQTVLSVSHLIADSRLHRSLFAAFNYQAKALRLLQESISAIDITEGVAIAVALLVWINLCQANIPAMGKHLKGLYLIFQEVQKRQMDGRTPSSLLLQMWRFSVRLDSIATIMFFPRKPIFPHVLMSQYNNDGQWVHLSTPTEKATEWTLTSFALDSLIHRTCHVACWAHEARRTPIEETEQQIQQLTMTLLEEHKQWSQRKIILEAEKFEKEADDQLNAFLPSASAPAFFDYEPIRVYNIYYGNMRNCWRAIYILIDLIAHPQYGPVTLSSDRYQNAIDICRVYNSLGERGQIFPFGKVPSVFLCGIGLGGRRRSPKEGGWLYEHAVKEMKEAFPLNTGALDAYCSLWDGEGNYWTTLERLNARLSSSAGR